MRQLNAAAVFAVCCLALAGGGVGCSRSSGGFEPKLKEPPIEGSKSDPAVQLKVEWRPGQSYLFSAESIMDTLWQGTDRRRRSDQEVVLGMDYKLTPTNRLSNSRWLLDFELMALWMDFYDGDRNYLSFDSESNVAQPMQNPASGLLYQLIGTHLGFEVGEDLHVRRILGYTELFSRFEKDRNAARASWVLRRALTYGLLRRLADLHPVPDRPLNIGGTWTDQREFPAPAGGTYIAELTYTFRGWQLHANRRCARIDFDVALKEKPAPEPSSNSNTRRRGDSTRSRRSGSAFRLEKGSAQGQLWLDPEWAMYTGMRLDQRMVLKGSIRRSRDPKAPATEMTQEIHEEFTLDLLGIQAAPPAKDAG